MNENCGCGIGTGKGSRMVLLLLVVAGVIVALVLTLTNRPDAKPTTAVGTTKPQAAQTDTGQTDHRVVHLDGQTFDQAVAKGVTLVDFYADWCAPCRMMAPVLVDVARELGATAKVAKVNVDDNRALARRFNVEGIPLLVVLKDGKEVQRLVGLRQKQEILHTVKRHLN